MQQLWDSFVRGDRAQALMVVACALGYRQREMHGGLFLATMSVQKKKNVCAISVTRLLSRVEAEHTEEFIQPPI